MHSAVFVYGTLQRGQERETCWPHPPRDIQPGYVTGQLFDLGPYPALVAGDGVVAGELWLLDESNLAETLQVLDEIEGYVGPSGPNLYLRETTRVYCDLNLRDPAPLAAHVYRMPTSLLPRGAMRIPSPARWPTNQFTAETRRRMPDPFDD